MSDRFRQIARDIASESFDTSDYPEVSALRALRGDFTALQREIVEEAAYSLGSSARRLEAGLQALALLDEELARVEATDGSRREELVQRFNAQREDVLLRLHYVRIQREALGFTRHTELDQHYRVPPKKK